MDSNILAATIGVIGGFLASLSLFYLNRFYTNYDNKIRKNPTRKIIVS